MGVLVKLSCTEQHEHVFGPGEHGARWLGLDVLHLPAGEAWCGVTGDDEAVLVILSGRCNVRVPGLPGARWRLLGSRPDIFSGSPTAIYVPRKSRVEVAAEARAEVAIVKAPCEVDLPPTLITPGDVKERPVGTASWRRDVRLILPPGSPVSQRLIVGETLNPPGNWSGIPPHRHDRRGPDENRLDEFYLFKTKPTDGYAVQLLYGDRGSEAHIVGNDDVLLLNGYHPTVAAPGVTVCYLWALAGDHKAYDITTDPRFAWVAGAEEAARQLERNA